eukprot:1389821-Amorphochlora_amoeboformis.AAC.1
MMKRNLKSHITHVPSSPPLVGSEEREVRGVLFVGKIREIREGAGVAWGLRDGLGGMGVLWITAWIRRGSG